MRERGAEWGLGERLGMLSDLEKEKGTLAESHGKGNDALMVSRGFWGYFAKGKWTTLNLLVIVFFISKGLQGMGLRIWREIAKTPLKQLPCSPAPPWIPIHQEEKRSTLLLPPSSCSLTNEMIFVCPDEWRYFLEISCPKLRLRFFLCVCYDVKGWPAKN